MTRVTGRIDLGERPTNDLSPVQQALIGPLSRNGAFDAEILFTCDPGDFEECGAFRNGYHREKRGVIRLTVVTRLAREGRPPLVEEFQYSARVKVAAALLPVFSKFTLYVADMMPAGEVGPRLNLVDVDENGQVMPDSRARPLCLDHDGEAVNVSPGAVPNSYRDLVEGARGLVFLGSPGPVPLNLAWSPLSGAHSGVGEGFQFFRRATGDGFYWIGNAPTPGGPPVDLYQMDTGMSPSRHDSVRMFYDLLREKAPRFWPVFRDQMKLESSSVLRLFGTDGRRSPTLVLGDVRAISLMARSYNYPPLAGPPWNLPRGRTREKLYLYDNPGEFHLETTAANGMLVPLVRAGLLEPRREELGRYIQDYSSFVASRPYNLGLPFLNNNRVPDPWTMVAESDPLFAFFRRDVPATLLNAVPGPLRPAAPGTVSLREFDRLFEPVGDPHRVAWRIELPSAEDPTLTAALRRRGLLRGQMLTLSGWISVTHRERRLVLDQAWTCAGNGGIILEDGDLVVRAPVGPLGETRSQSMLYLVARQGDIRLETPAGARVQASLLAGGRVVFAGDPSLRLSGSVAMRGFCPPDGDLEGFPGGSLTYVPLLSALPATSGGTSPDPGEAPLLGMSFEPTPLVLE